jgi:hypothetical protein
MPDLVYFNIPKKIILREVNTSKNTKISKEIKYLHTDTITLYKGSATKSPVE